MTSSTHAQSSRRSAWLLFRIWTAIGLQSFGGGSATLLLIQRVFIQQRKWLTMEDFARLYNLSLLTPGITLVALTTLIGKRLGGARGIVASVAGLIVPSATITCLLTALFLRLERLPATGPVLRGVVPATAGVMLLVLVNFAQPIVRDGRKTGKVGLLAKGALALAVALGVIVGNLSAIVVVVAAALVGVVIFSRQPAPPLPVAGDDTP